MKRCGKCRLELDISQFHKDVQRADGLCLWCKACRRLARGATEYVPAVWHVDKTGYIKKGRIWQHRWVMEGMIGRKLKRREEIHHLDNDKTNNQPNNLVLLSSHAEHMSLYHPIHLRNGVHLTCTGCGKEKYYPLSHLLRSSKKKYRCYDCWRDPKYGRLALQK